MSDQTPWRPSRREQRLEWWASRLIGYGGLIWETVIDNLRDPTALVVFGGIAASEHVITYVRRERARMVEDRKRERSGLPLELEDDE